MEDYKQYTIIFAGDSITDAGKNSTPDGLGAGYVHLVADALVAFRPWNLIKIINAGVSGNTSRDLLNRWRTDVASHNADYIFCLIGANDVWRQMDYRAFPEDLVLPEEYESNLIQFAKQTGGKAKFFFMTPFYMESNPKDEMRILMEKYAAIMKRVAEENGIPIIDLQDGFDRYMEYRPGQSICWDRVHPGRIGAQIIARDVLDTLEQELRGQDER